MNVKITASGVTVFDSLLPVDSCRRPMAATIRETLNKGGTATITLIPGHPFYDAFNPLKTEVVFYKNDVLRWRGRALVPDDDLYCRRTIVCEGELCFLNDAIRRPCSLSGTATTVFGRVIADYNTAVEPWKRFAVGTVTVDVNVALEINKAEKVYETVQRLVKNYGGYIIFDSAPDGTRRINWYKSLPYTCNQRIRFGKNLLDYSAQSAVTGFVTRLIPYGAEDENGNPLKLNSYGYGKDYVENEAAIEMCGIVEDCVYYDDVTDVFSLHNRATEDLLKASTLPRVIQLTALDLSHQDVALESFMIGQRVGGESKPHGMTGEYDLVSLEEDLLNPSAGSVVLTRSADYLNGEGTLTGNISQTQRSEAERIRKEFLAKQQEYREKIQAAYEKATAEAEAKAQELADAAQDAAEEFSKEYTDEAEQDANNYTDTAKQEAKDYADDAADAAGSAALSDAKSYTDALNKMLDAVEVFNRLTDNGAIQGIFKENGKYYFNASHIKTGSLSADLIRTGFLLAQYVALSGKFEVYDGDVLGGHLGYMSGSDGDTTTNGMGMSDPDVKHYVIVTTAGVRMQSGDTVFYINDDGQAVVKGDLLVSGNIVQNASAD